MLYCDLCTPVPLLGELGSRLHAYHPVILQLDLKSYVATIEYTETEEEENNVKILDLVKSGEIAFSESISLLTAPILTSLLQCAAHVHSHCGRAFLQWCHLSWQHAPSGALPASACRVPSAVTSAAGCA